MSVGVYIKGMEMPQNCEECDVKAVCKNYWKLIREQHTRPSWCPLVLVPPHGRTIDADAFLSTIRPICDEDTNAACTFETVKRLMIEHISDAPTIIPAEEGET